MGERCAACGAPMAADQRYCLECGERRAVMSSVLLGGPPPPLEPGASASPPVRPPDSAIAPGRDDRGRSDALSVIAGVGVLLLAMGVGVLIGRSSASTKTLPPEVITVGSSGSAGTGTGSGDQASTATFTGDWPSGTSGYTVQLQTLPSGTQVSAVEAAKSAASAKGAKNVGALESEEFSSLGGTNYVVYSGVYHKRSEAQSALKGLKKSFHGATVIQVSNGGEGGKDSGSGGSSGLGERGGHHSGVGYSESKPAPPTIVKKESTKKGQSYEQESKNLPNVISTG